MLIPDIMKQLNELRMQVNDLKKELQTKNRIIPQEEVDVVECEDIISELIERQRRASNIIISNIKEPTSANSCENRIEEDKKAVNGILNEINIDLSNTNVFRLGKYEPSKTKLLKVVLNNADDAMNILRHKRNISTSSVRIFADQIKGSKIIFLPLKD